ncbi:MAG: pro-sigmaK processing inhibitor BofA family protein [Clostridiales bacterium]|nr:pro-sigmaK processing inhibitor BofA family protein [Clostridiales bacterium]
MNIDLIFWIASIIVMLIMLIYYISRRKKLKTFFFGALTGLAALFLLNKFGDNFGTYLPLNIFNLCGSTILGVPFVICLVLLKIL